MADSPQKPLLFLNFESSVLDEGVLGSGVLAKAVRDAGLPVAFVGVVIAAVILLPEGVAALRAAMLNRMQTSLNAALGSALATIGLVPMEP